MKTLCYTTTAALAMLLLTGLSAQAALVLYDGFDYGATGGAIVGQGGVGGGWAGPWGEGGFVYTGSPTHTTSYQSGGLSFSDLPVTGGNAYLTGSGNGGWNLGRQHSATITGDVYGSYLIRPISVPFGVTILGLFDGVNLNHPSAYARFAVEPRAYSGSTGGVLMEGAYAYSQSGSATVTSGQTYLALFKATGMGALPTSQSITMWTLTEAQYDHFKPGGLTEAELNGASLGGSSTQVYQRATKSTSSTSYEFASGNYLMFEQYYGGAAQFDELRVSDTSLQETLIPEPASLTLLALGAMAVLLRR